MFSYVEVAGRFSLARKAAMFLISVVAHIAAILLLILVPLIFIGAVPESVLLSFVLAAPPPPPAQVPPVPPAGREARPAPRIVIPTNEFSEPGRIPKGIPVPPSEPMPGDSQSLAPAGVIGSPLGGNNNGVIGSPLGSVLTEIAPPSAPPPPPKLVKKPAYRPGGNVQAAKLIRKVEPEYPPLALQARVSGAVVLDVNLDEEGNVESIRVLQGHQLLVPAAVKAVSQWKYSPTILNGEPVPVVATVTVIFTLR